MHKKVKAVSNKGVCCRIKSFKHANHKYGPWHLSLCSLKMTLWWLVTLVWRGRPVIIALLPPQMFCPIFKYFKYNVHLFLWFFCCMGLLWEILRWDGRAAGWWERRLRDSLKVKRWRWGHSIPQSDCTHKNNLSVILKWMTVLLPC